MCCSLPVKLDALPAGQKEGKQTDKHGRKRTYDVILATFRVTIFPMQNNAY
jgi:hypothetical protein